MVDDSKGRWQLLMCGIPHGPLRGPIQFNVSMLAFDAKLGEGEVSAVEVRLPFRREP